MWTADHIPLHELKYISIVGFLLPHLNWNSTKKTSMKKISINLLNTAQTLITLSKWHTLKPLVHSIESLWRSQFLCLAENSCCLLGQKAKWNFQCHYHSKRLLWAKQICSLWVFKLWTESENKNRISLAALLPPWCHTEQLSSVVTCSSQDGICEIWHKQLDSSSSSPQEWHKWLSAGQELC